MTNAIALEIQDLKVISCDELKGYDVSPGYIFWRKKVLARSVQLYAPGDILDHKYLKKFEAYPESLGVQLTCHSEFIEKSIKLFKAYQAAARGRERALKREEVLHWFYDHYWLMNNKSNFLDFVQVMNRSFSHFDHRHKFALKKLPVDLEKRLYALAALNTFYALVLGYHDPKFLEDIYSLSFLFDLSLSGKGLTQQVWKSFEKSRQHDRSILRLEKLSIEDKTYLESHPQRSFEIAMRGFSDIFNDPENLRFITRFQERLDGDGFPRKIKASEMSSIEQLFILTNNLLPYEEFSYCDLENNFLFHFMREKDHLKDKSLNMTLKKAFLEKWGHS